MIKLTMTVTVSKAENHRPRPRVYFTHKDESIAHNLCWRRCRPIQLYFDLLPTILRDAGLTVTDEEASEPTALGTWDQFAACECGCSPAITLSRHGLHDLYVTIAVQSQVTDAGDTSANT
jgi:hypothetical protein